MKRSISCFVLMFFLASHAPSYAQDFDNLDQYFEDYFKEDEDFETTKDEDLFGEEEVKKEEPKETVTEKENAAAPSGSDLSEKSDAANDFSPIEEVAKEITSTPSSSTPDNTKSTSEEDSVKERLVQDTVRVALTPEEKERLESLTENSYLNFPEEEVREIQSLLTDKYELRQSAKTMQKLSNLLVGEEIERPMVFIHGAEDDQKETQFKSLKQCVEIATENHLPIDIAREKVLLYRRNIRKSVRDLYPAVSFVGFDRRANTGAQSNTITRTQELKMVINQPIFQGGAIWNKVREEKENLKAAIAEYNKIFSDLALEVATAYFNLAKSITLFEHRKKLLEIANRSLDLSQEKYDANLISEIEHLNVQSQQSQLNHNVEQAKEDLELALLEMQKSMNVDLNYDLDVQTLDEFFKSVGGLSLIEEEEEKKESEAPEENKINQLIELAYDNRPEFVIGEHKVRAKKFAEKVQKADWLPKANLYMEVGSNREVLDLQDEIGELGWEEVFRFGIDFNWNIAGSTLRHNYETNEAAPRKSGFDNGGEGDWQRGNTISFGVLDNLEQFSRSKQTEIEHKEAILEFELSEKDMVSEVKESYYNYNRARIQMRSVLKKIRYREKLVELASHRSEINEIQISEYLQSEIDLVEEKNAFYQAMIDFFIAKSSLNKAVGMTNFLEVEALKSEIITRPVT